MTLMKITSFAVSLFFLLATSQLVGQESPSGGQERVGVWSGSPETTTIQIGYDKSLRIYKKNYGDQASTFFYEPLPQLKSWAIKFKPKEKNCEIKLEIAFPNIETIWNKEYAKAKKELDETYKLEGKKVTLGAMSLSGLKVSISTGSGNKIELSQQANNPTLSKVLGGTFNYSKNSFSPDEYERLQDNKENLSVIVETSYPLSSVTVGIVSKSLTRNLSDKLKEDYGGGKSGELVVTQSGKQELISLMSTVSKGWIGTGMTQKDLKAVKEDIDELYSEIPLEMIEEKIWLTSKNMRIALSPSTFKSLANSYSTKDEFHKETKKDYQFLSDVAKESKNTEDFYNKVKGKFSGSSNADVGGNIVDMLSGYIDTDLSLSGEFENISHNKREGFEKLRNLLKTEQHLYENLSNVIEKNFDGVEEIYRTNPKNVKLYRIRLQDLCSRFSSELVKQLDGFKNYFGVKEWSLTTDRVKPPIIDYVFNILQSNKSYSGGVESDNYETKRNILDNLYRRGEILRYEFPEIPYTVRHSGSGHNFILDENNKPITYQGKPYLEVASNNPVRTKWEAKVPEFIHPNKILCMDEIVPLYVIRVVDFKNIESSANGTIATADISFVHNTKLYPDGGVKNNYVVFRPVLYYLP